MYEIELTTTDRTYHYGSLQAYHDDMAKRRNDVKRLGVAAVKALSDKENPNRHVELMAKHDDDNKVIEVLHAAYMDEMSKYYTNLAKETK